jgi:hypothetical protein
MKTVKVAEFSRFPGPRYKKLGPHSGEEFRDNVLKVALENNDEVLVDLDDVFGYGSSFLEEAFGGLVRLNVSDLKLTFLMENLKSEDDPSLKEEIIEYIQDAQRGN